MNTINYSNTLKKFPLSTKSLIFAQEMIKQCFNLALIGGNTPYILSGCENTTGNNWSEGLVVINGELMIFTGGAGTTASKVRVKTTTSDVIAEYETYEGVYTVRILEFGTNVANEETYTWSNFVRIKSNLELAAECATKTELNALANLVFPKGGIIQYDILNNNPLDPEYWQLCDGTNIAGYGVVPDYRGRVVLGIDSRKVNIPTDVSDLTENYGAAGNKGGKPSVLLTAAQSGIRAHTHDIQGVSRTDDNNFTTTSAFAAADKNLGAGWDFTLASKTVTESSATEFHENRMAYIVMPSFVKIK